ncbi:hypothetical protein Tco_0244752, partial [Tanacetum coccineum]
GGGSVGRGGGSVGRGNSKRGGGRGGGSVGKGGGSVGRGNSKRGGGSVGRGGVKRGGSNSMDIEFRKDQEAEREVMEEVRTAREKERLEIEQYAKTYSNWEDLQSEGFEEPNPNLRLATMSDLVAADEAHDEHFNNMPSLTNDVSLDVSHTIEGNNDALLNVALPINMAAPNNVVVPNNEQPTPDATQTSSQSSRVVLHPR